jgi:hypothetical protein
MKNLASQASCKTTPKKRRSPAPETPPRKPNPPNAKSIVGGFLATIFNAVFIFVYPPRFRWDRIQEIFQKRTDSLHLSSFL